jgi:protein disulfide-isomerase-like protein
MLTKILLVAVLLVAAAFADVVTLTPENYDSIVKDTSKNVFVKFYAPWCGHCQRMAGAWQELAKSTAGTDVVVAELDCDKYRDLGQANGIRGFPTIKLFKKGDNKEAVNYQGARDVAAFQSWLSNNKA